MHLSELISFGEISNERVSKFEERIGSILPRDYRQFLVENNGGKPKGVYIGAVDAAGGREADVSVFLGLDLPERYNTLDFGRECDIGRSGLDYSKYISIAHGSAQIVYRICLLPELFGAIFFDDQNFEGHVYKMADSWSAFFDMLYLDDTGIW